MLLDYHAHVNFSAFQNDADQVIKRALDGGVFMILVGTQIDTSRRAVEIAAQYEKGVWAAVGLHPIHLEKTARDEEESHFISRAEIFDLEAYRALGEHNKVVAIGECGLDYFHLPADISENVVKEKQHAAFRQHLDLAGALDLPLIMHCRGSLANPTDAYQDMLQILSEYTAAGKIKRRGSIHCFVSTWAIAQRFLALGFHIGFTGVITFTKGGAGPYDEVVRHVPLDRILVETDCPYLAPVPMRGKRNEPLYVRYVAEYVAEIKGLGKTDVETQLFKNALNVFSRITI